ncbi:MAG: DUF2157 domain-containing protein, partial [Kiritimatiellaeota bacterium]|nr:DUF2157 domain-containing protein [Kiritimatiellota bacterium]
MSKKAIQWLYSELPRLVAQGILTPDADAKLRAYYGPVEPAKVRAGLSFLPLVLAQGLVAWVMVNRPQSLAWREGTGALLFLMIGASISLVAQTYNISGDLPRFILTWALLGLPVVYLLKAVVPALLYLWGITEWACHIRWEEGWAAGYWPLAALLLPVLAMWLRAGRYQVRPTLLLWALCISVTVAAGV